MGIGVSGLSCIIGSNLAFVRIGSGVGKSTSGTAKGWVEGIAGSDMARWPRSVSCVVF